MTATNSPKSSERRTPDRIPIDQKPKRTSVKQKWHKVSVASALVLLGGLLFSRFYKEVGQILLPNYVKNGDNSTEFSSSLVINGTDTRGECTCSSPENSLHRSTAARLGLQGEVSDCCCSFDAIEKTNEELYPLLRRIVATPFFSHFKIDLCSECQLWEDSPMCVLRDCGVCECESPPLWASEVDWMPDEFECRHIEDKVVTSVDAHVTDTFGSRVQTDTFFGEDMTAEIEDEDTAVVVDLRRNPEQYTGYTGRSAEKVWKAVHEENCFQQEDQSDGTCSLSADQRIYNRVIGGLHSSISLHIASSYCLELDTTRIAECKTWGQNRTLAYERVLSQKDRLENLYVVFAVVLRAVQKAATAITVAVPQDSYFSESLIEWKERLQPELLKITRSCPLTFDESELFNTYAQEDTEYKRIELKRRINHLIKVMECVGCDRCKLWGTLQSLGIGTALRIIIDDDDLQVTNLSRQEAVALVHTLERFSSALVYADKLR